MPRRNIGVVLLPNQLLLITLLTSIITPRRLTDGVFIRNYRQISVII